MKRFLLAIAATLTIIGPAGAATCTSSFSFGTVSAPALRTLGNDFSSAQHFSDCYNFVLGAPSSVLGLTLEFDASLLRSIDLTSVSISGGSLPSTIVDTSPGSFSFGNLIAGGYQLVITGDVTGRSGGFLGGGLVGYGGLFATVQAAPVSPSGGGRLVGLVQLVRNSPYGQP